MAIAETEMRSIKMSGTYNMPPIRVMADAAETELPFTPRIFKESLIKKFFVPASITVIMSDNSQIISASIVQYKIDADGVVTLFIEHTNGGIKFTSINDDSKTWNVMRGE